MQVLFYCSETYDDSIENEKSLQNARIIKEFWNDYYAKLLDIDKTKKTSNVDMYQDDVIKLWHMVFSCSTLLHQPLKMTL